MTFDENNFLVYLKNHYPHLYVFEMEVRKVYQETGYGDVYADGRLEVDGKEVGGASASSVVRNRAVFSCDVTHWVKNLFK